MKNISFALLFVLTTAVSAQAVTTTSFPLITSGTFDNPGDGANTFAIRIATTTDWTNSDLLINLTSGAMIHHLEVPSFGSPFAVPGTAAPHVGDTAVWSPIADAGDFNSAFPAGTSLSGPSPYDNSSESPTSWYVSWFNTSNTDIGNFDIGMITLTDDAEGTISWRTISAALVEEGGFTSGSDDTYKIVGGQIVEVSAVPEPGSIALVAFGLIGMMGTRHRRNG